VALLDRRLDRSRDRQPGENAIKFSPTKTEVLIDRDPTTDASSCAFKIAGRASRPPSIEALPALQRARRSAPGLRRPRLFIVKTLVDAQAAWSRELPESGGNDLRDLVPRRRAALKNETALARRGGPQTRTKSASFSAAGSIGDHVRRCAPRVRGAEERRSPPAGSLLPPASRGRRHVPARTARHPTLVALPGVHALLRAVVRADSSL